tara:strand:- start:1843 stop:2922 length:1080 start_codon:yes stop_codon:yes gene_type:complete
MKSPTPRKSIFELVPYKPNFGKSNVKSFIRLSANENPYGFSPKILKKVNNTDFNRYPLQHNEKLINVIADRHHLDKNKIILGNGSDELISILSQSYLNPGDEAICTEYGFLQFPQSILISGGKPVIAKDKNLTVSVKNILQNVTKKTRLVFIANPNNPTGTFINKKDVINLIENLPKNILLVYDAAYAEYIDEKSYIDGSELVEKYNNVIMLRTFSKMHGLAALRLGWGYCSEKILNTLMSVRPPFSVNSVAVNCGIIAMQDLDFQKKCLEHNKNNMKWIEKELKNLDLDFQRSSANFILIKFPIDKKNNSKKAEEYLSKNGILVRSMEIYNLPNHIRLSLGTFEENKFFIKVLKKFLS